MTKKDFFIMAVKVISLYIVLTAIIVWLPSLLISIWRLHEIEQYIAAIIGHVIITGMALLCIAKAREIVDMLGIDKKFETAEINLGAVTDFNLTRIAIIVIGCLQIASQISSLFTDLIFTFVESASNQAQQGLIVYEWVHKLMSLTFGAIIIYQSKRITEIFFQKDKVDVEIDRYSL
jgi:hypothetical protein